MVASASAPSRKRSGDATAGNEPATKRPKAAPKAPARSRAPSGRKADAAGHVDVYAPVAELSEIKKGKITAYYPQGGLTGERYGYIEESVETPPAASFRDGALQFKVVKHYCFEDHDADAALIAELGAEQYHKKPVFVIFRQLGLDRCGRLKAVKVRMASDEELALVAAQEASRLKKLEPRDVKVKVEEEEANDPRSQAERQVKALIVKAWKALGGLATRPAILKKIRTTPADLQAAEAIEMELQMLDTEASWEAVAKRLVRKLGYQEEQQDEGQKARWRLMAEPV